MFRKALNVPLHFFAFLAITLHLFSFSSGQATLVGYWKLNEGSGATLLDNSGNGNNAILQNAKDVTWVTGKDGLALNLPGTTNRFAIAPNQASLNITDKLTIAAWIKPAGLYTSTILSKTGTDGYELATNTNGKIEFRFNSDTYGSTYRILSNTSYPADGNTWVHVAATYDGASSKIYINGILDVTVTFSNPVAIKTNTSGLYIGSLLGSRRWRGALDDIRLYHGALTAAEIGQVIGSAIPSPATPLLVAPANSSVNIPYNQTLSWNAAANATKYRVEVSELSSFASFFLAQNDIATTSLQLANLLPNQVYYWRVRASNSGGDGPWSAVWSFTTAPVPPPAAPVLIGHWKMNEASGATLLDNSGNGNNAVLQNLSDVTRVTGKDGLALNLPGTTNRFAIAPNQASLNITDYLSIAAWIRPTGLNTATILSKTGTDGYELATNTNGKIEFRFNSDTYGTTYRILSNTSYPSNGSTWMHVAATYDGASSKIYINGILDVTVTFSNPVAIKPNTSGLYIGSLLGSRRWKGTLDDVRLYRGALNATEIGQLPGLAPTPPAAPLLSAPADLSVNIPYNQTLSWNAVTDALKYRVEVSENSTFTTTFLAQDNITATSLELSNLLPNTIYYWRVRGSNNGGNGNWSAVWSFATLPLPPAVPVLIAPSDAAIDIPYSQTLSWGAVAGAAKYRAEVSEDAGFTTFFLAQDNIATTSIQLSNLLPAKTYYWRVRAGNSGGDGDWSAVWSFTTAPLPLPAAPVLVSPANAGVNISINPTLSWNASPGASKYRAELSTDQTFSTTFFTQSDIATTSVVVPTLLAGQVYYWRVRASNTSGDGDWSAVRSFTTASAPTLTLIHYWNFNGASVAAMITPTLTLNGGSLTENLIAGSTTEVGTANGFTGVNARNGDPTGNHYRLNNAIGSILTFNIPTTNYKDVIFKYETRRSTSGSEIQKISYSLDGSTYVPYQTLNINNVVPVLITFDFSAITGVNNNPNFKIKIEFEQGVGSLAGNNRFDNVTVEGISTGVVIPLPDQVQTTTPANNAQNVILHPVFNWLAASNAVSYEVEVASDNLFTNIVAQKTLSALLTYKLESALAISTNYFWRVRAVNTAGDGPWSDVKTFQTVLQATVYSLAINEAMSSNSSVIADDDGTFQDWVELVNYGTSPVNLQGFGLTDAPATPYKWVFPAKILAPGEFLIVWASNKNRTDPNHPLHTNFAISSGGEDLLVTSPDGEWSNLLPSIVIPANSSRGHEPDGTGALKFFSIPTPGATNIGGVEEIITKAIFSQAPGIYPGNLTLAITHPDPLVTIRYTLDGSEPTQTSPIYQQPLQIVDRSGDPNVVSLIPTNNIVGTSRSWVPPNGLVRKGAVVRAKAFKANSAESPSITGTYIVLPGRQYTVPVLSVVAPPDSLFGFNRGIYVPGVDYISGNDETGNYFQKGDSSERPGSIEFYSPGLSFQQNIGFRINGNSTRKYPQKSLRLVARSQYGNSSIDYPIFPNYALSSFKRLVLSSSGNDWGHTMFKDAVASMLVSHIMPAESYRPSVVFINGEYWGIHNIRERADKFYLGQKYGVDPDNIDHLVEKYEVEEGDNLDYLEMLNYVQNTDLTSDANFEGVKQRMDVDNYIDYMSAEVYSANNDWPHNNIEYWRAKVANNRNPGAPIGQDGRWRWIFHDIDAGFGNPSFNSITWVTSLYSPFNGKDWPNLLLRKLLTNQQFKVDFINRIADQLNTAFITSRINYTIDSVKTLIAPEIPEHIQRWTRPSSVTGWTKDVDSMKLFASQRPAYLRQHLKTAFGIGNELIINLDVSDKAHGSIKLNSLTVNSNTVGLLNPQQPYPWQGVYFGNVPVKLKALPGQGYVFDYWFIDGQVFNNEEMTLTAVANSSVKAFFVQTTGIKPVLISPANTATNIAVPAANFSWQPVDQASSYRLQVSLVADFSTRIFDQSGLTNTDTDVPGLVYNTSYYWRVMATGSNGSSDWSDVRSFTSISFPDVVQLAAPANLATNVPVNAVLSWNTTATATNYSVQVSVKPDFSSFVINKENVQTTSLPYSGLLRNQVYYWRVKANNGNGSSAWSQRSFTTATLVYTTDFVGHWKMNEDTGSVLMDYSGYGNHAVLQNINDVYRVTGIEGLALSLQGSTSRFAIAPNSPSLNITNAITIAAWIRPTEVGTRTILSKSGLNGYELATNSNGKFEFRINPDASGSTYRLYSVSSYPFDGITWMHVAATFDGASSKIYINGVLNATVTFQNPTTIISNTSGLYIGSLLASRRWKGLLDDIQLYKRALSAAEIMDIVNPQPVTGLAPLYSTRLPEVQKSNLKVYPNPIQDRINLDFKQQFKGNVYVSVIDAVGRTYYKSHQTLESNRMTISLADARLKPGIYFLIVKSSGYNEFMKLVKN